LQIVNSENFNSSIQTILNVSLDQLNQHLENIVTGQHQQLNNSFNRLMESQEVSVLALNSSIQMDLIQHGELLDELRFLHLISPVSSCAALNNLTLSFPSGYYWVVASNGSAVRVYCDMTRSCGGVIGGWMRVTELDMTNMSHRCPSGFMQRMDSSIRSCVRNSASTQGCQEFLSTSGFSYSKVCGRATAYQVGTTDAFGRSTTTDDNYADGISLTYGSPRQHIWTFAAGGRESVDGYSCPCIQNSGVQPPSFVGTDYFCETGNNEVHRSMIQILYPDPLWDGTGCGPQSTCCTFNNPPWFYKQLPQPTTDDIEMRVCTDELRMNEDIAIESVDIYIQ
jgi:hypothetical protein